MGFRYARQVHFSDTDMVGIVHFSMFFRYMEEAEHALWRAAGLSIFEGADEAGWPKVAATFDYKSPLRFPDQFFVEVELATVTVRSIRYSFAVTRDGMLVGNGALTTVCARKQEGGLRAVEVPPDIVARLTAAIAENRQA